MTIDAVFDSVDVSGAPEVEPVVPAIVDEFEVRQTHADRDQVVVSVFAYDHRGSAVLSEPLRERLANEILQVLVVDAALDDDTGEVGAGCVHFWTPPLGVGTLMRCHLVLHKKEITSSQ